MNVHKNNINMAMKGAVILTIAGLITKVLSAAYRVPYQNIVGDIGFYIYQQVYPFYGMSVILATTGFPVMISKVMADFGYRKPAQVRAKILTIIFIYLLILGFLLGFTLYGLADEISGFMGDSHLAPLIQVTSFAFLIVPFVSVFRGYYQSEQNMHPTAISLVAEQSIRVTLILLSSYLLIETGHNLYEAGFGAITGSIFGSLASLLVLVYYWRRNKHSTISWNITANIEIWKIFFSLVKYSWTIGLSSLLLILIQLVDALNLYSLLVGGGMGEVLAKETKGVYDRGQPLIQLGTVVATSLSLSLVPIFANAKIQENSKFIQEKLNLSIKVCVVVGAGASAGLIMILKPVNVMLFTNNSGSIPLMVLSGSIFFTSLCLTLFAILQGLGYTFFPALSVIIGITVKLIMNNALIPGYGVLGAAVSTVFAYSTITLLIIFYMYVKGYPFSQNRSLIKIAIAIIIMSLLLHITLKAAGDAFNLEDRLYAGIVSIGGVLLGGSIYCLLILRLNVFSQEELKYIPVLKKLVK